MDCERNRQCRNPTEYRADRRISGPGNRAGRCQKEQLVPFLIASIVVSAIIWYFTEAFGMIFTGMATDFNSGLLLVVMALACWPRESAAMESKRVRFSSDLRHRARAMSEEAQHT